MTNEKVTLPREVAEALTECERNYISADITLIFHAQNGLIGKYAPLQTLTISELASALINGYEVEKSPEEKVREYYVKTNEAVADTQQAAFLGERLGIKSTLDLLGIKIGGVNA